MIENDRELVHSEVVKAGKRIYYFDVKESRNGDRYLAITESKKIVSGPTEAPNFTFEKHKLFLYKEDFEKFKTALANAIDVAKSGQPTQDVAEAESAAPSGSEEVATAIDDLA